MVRDVSHEPRWPRGTPVGPSGHGPGGGRWMGAASAAEGAVGWAERALTRPGQRHNSYGPLGMSSEELFHLAHQGPPWRTGNPQTTEADKAMQAISEAVRDGRAEYAEIQAADGSWNHITGAQAAIMQGNAGNAAVTYRLIHRPYRERVLTGGNMAVTKVRTYDDGRMVVIKKQDPQGAHAEYLASVLGEALGAPVPAVVLDPDEPSGVWMAHVKGQSGMAIGIDIAAGNPPFGGVKALFDWMSPTELATMFDHDEFHNADVIEEYVAGPQVMAGGRAWRMALLDVLIGNFDRHPGNWILTPDGHMVGIDHGNAFHNQEEHGSDSPPAWVHDFRLYHWLLDQTGRYWDGKLISLEEATAIDEKLRSEDVRGEFERLGRDEWYARAYSIWQGFYGRVIADHRREE